jgi:hypothetical protein
MIVLPAGQGKQTRARAGSYYRRGRVNRPGHAQDHIKPVYEQSPTVIVAE